MKNPTALILAAFAAQALCAGAAIADDFRNREPWDFKVRRSATATARASMMWQVEQLSRSNAQSAGAPQGAGSGGAAVSSVNSVANMNIITITVGDGGTADVAIETEQANHGTVDGTAVAASGDAVDIGTIK